LTPHQRTKHQREVIATLAVIEQTDDEDFLEKGADAFDEVLSQYGLKTLSFHR
jgi:hypothetical protein